MKYVYPCNIALDEEEMEATGRVAYTVEFPDVRGAVTCGWSWEEAVEMAEDLLITALATCYRHGEDIPTPGPLSKGQVPICLPPVPAAKVALNRAMQKRGLTTVALADKLGMDESAVVKLRDPRHGSHMSTVERALRIVGLRLAVEDVPVAECPPPSYPLADNTERLVLQRQLT